MEAVDQLRLRHPVDDRLGTGHADHTGEIARGPVHLLLQIVDRGLNALGVGQQPFAEFRQTIASRLPRHQWAPDPSLELGEPAVDRRLAETERLSRRDGAVMMCDGKQVFQVVPVEHALIMHFCCPRLAILRLPRPIGGA